MTSAGGPPPTLKRLFVKRRLTMNEIDLSRALGLFFRIGKTLSKLKKHMLDDDHQMQASEEKELRVLWAEFTKTIKAGEK